MKLKDYREKRMQDPEMQAAYQKLRPKLELGQQILELRLERGWTQKELAKKAGTKQANISRLENALLNPSIEMLQKVANALGAELSVQIMPEGQAVQVSQEHTAVSETLDIAIVSVYRPKPIWQMRTTDQSAEYSITDISPELPTLPNHRTAVSTVRVLH